MIEQNKYFFEYCWNKSSSTVNFANEYPKLIILMIFYTYFPLKVLVSSIFKI